MAQKKHILLKSLRKSMEIQDRIQNSVRPFLEHEEQIRKMVEISDALKGDLPSAATLSPAMEVIAKFEENGVIRLTASEGRKKSYIITDIGRDMLWQEYVRLQVMVRDGSRFLGEKIEK